MNPAANDGSTLYDCPQRHGNERAGRGENDGRVEHPGRRLAGGTRPDCPEIASELLRLDVSGPCERIDLTTLEKRNLGDDVSRRSETVDTEPSSVPGHNQRAITDETCAQKRCCLGVRITFRDREAITLIGDGVFRVAAVERVTRKSRVVAEVFSSRAAIPALATRPSKPGSANSLTDTETVGARPDAIDEADNFVSRDHAGFWIRQFAVNHMQIGSANTTGMHADEELIRSWLRDRNVGRF